MNVCLGRAADLILNAYLARRDARQEVPLDMVEKLHQMAKSEPDDYVRRPIRKLLREPWTQS